MSKERAHSYVDFPEDLTSTFESDVVTDDIASNFSGVQIIKDIQSRLLHIFGDDQRQVENTVFALRNFISEACIQKIYADAENDAPGRVFPKPFSVYTDENIALEIKLKDTAPDITEEEIKNNFEWMNAEAIVCPQDSITGFLTGTVYAKFKDVSECTRIKATLVDFYPNYDIRFVSSDEWRKVRTARKNGNGKIDEKSYLPNQLNDNDMRRDTRSSRQNNPQSREFDVMSNGPIANENSRTNNKNGKSIRAPIIQADSPYGGSKATSSVSSARPPYYAQKSDNTLIPPQVRLETPRFDLMIILFFV